MTTNPTRRAALPGQHPDWCAQGHRCGLGEHRAQPVRVDIPGAGSITLVRVRATNGRQHAEIRLSVVLPEHEPAARLRLVALLTHLETLLGPATADRPHRTHNGFAA